MKLTTLEIVLASLLGLIVIAIIWLFVLLAHAGVLFGWD